MKKGIIALVALLSLNSFATTLVCSSNALKKDANYQDGINERISGRCVTNVVKLLPTPSVKTTELEFELKGVGLGIKHSIDEKFVINCPLTSLNALENSDYKGLKRNIRVGQITSVDMGIFKNDNGGICIVNGISLGQSTGTRSKATLMFRN